MESMKGCICAMHSKAVATKCHGRNKDGTGGVAFVQCTLASLRSVAYYRRTNRICCICSMHQNPVATSVPYLNCTGAPVASARCTQNSLLLLSTARQDDVHQLHLSDALKTRCYPADRSRINVHEPYVASARCTKNLLLQLFKKHSLLPPKLHLCDALKIRCYGLTSLWTRRIIMVASVQCTQSPLLRPKFYPSPPFLRSCICAMHSKLTATTRAGSIM